MNKKSLYLALCAAPLLIGWSGEPDKAGAKFYGKLTTRQKTQIVDAITVGDSKKTKAIHMYEKPKDMTANAEGIITLSIDPRKVISSIDLNEITELAIPNREVKWVYKEKNSLREHTYIEVVVTEKGGAQTSYLMDHDTKIHCQKTNEAPPKKTDKKEHVAIDMTVELEAIKNIVIEGYYSDETVCKTGK